MSRHFDLADEEVEPITFTWKRKTYRLRGVAPALPVLRASRAALDGELDREVDAEAITELTEAIFEDGELNRILRAGISFSKLLEVVRRYMAIMRGDNEGEVRPPATGATKRSRSSSSGSISSRRTSNGSIESTSGQHSAPA